MLFAKNNTLVGNFYCVRTFIGIAVHNAASAGGGSMIIDLAAGVRQDATGLLGTTVQLSDLVRRSSSNSCIPKPPTGKRS